MTQRTAPYTGALQTSIAGEQIALLPERAMLWERQRLLLIADPHFGKAQTFRAAGIAAPERSHAADLARLSALIERTGIERLVVLGDLLHSRSGVGDAVLDALTIWRGTHRSLTVTLVRGNHDRSAGDPPASLEIDCVDPGLRIGPFALHHEPEHASADAYSLCGHIHPGVQLGGSGRLGRKTGAKFPAFVMHARSAILPAFGRFTGLATVRPEPGDRLGVIADGEVIGMTVR
jgi:DNA ligase-associated metallophosphoesterase